MRIVSLVENTSSRADISAEHGLSLYIEACGRKILFDMGQTNLFEDNARALGIDLFKVDIAILSHGHYDHSGGLKRFLEINEHSPVYLSRHAPLCHYRGREKYIGIDQSLVKNPRLIFIDSEYKIANGLTLLSAEKMPTVTEAVSDGLTERIGDEFIPDDFRHEIYLLITEGGKRTLISGCSHKGIVNITEWLSPDVLVGGFHLSKLPKGEALAGYARMLASHKTDFYTCHCTGKEQFEFMKSYMGRLRYFSAGDIINI